MRFRIDPGELANPLQILGHEGERFFLPHFSVSKPDDRCAVFGIGSQVKAAQPFYSHNFTLSDELRRLLNRIIGSNCFPAVII